MLIVTRLRSTSRVFGFQTFLNDSLLKMAYGFLCELNNFFNLIISYYDYSDKVLRLQNVKLFSRQNCIGILYWLLSWILRQGNTISRLILLHRTALAMDSFSDDPFFGIIYDVYQCSMQTLLSAYSFCGEATIEI